MAPDPAERLAATDLTPRQAALLEWFETVGRDLPWRRTRDPWGVLVAELMLQQTQVGRVVDRWTRFLGRFPTVAACAAVPLADVVDEWSGLGYNRRAVNLHRLAVAVVEQHAGRLPDDLTGLQALPGIGPYTARAVLAFAHERPVGVLDTNAARVHARWAGRTLKPREAQALADAAVPAGHAWAWNQAMLDLGATVCVSRSPRCGQCPVSSTCTWWLAGAGAGPGSPDPAVGSAGVSGRQSTFAGSDRQGRGRLVDRLRRGPVTDAELAEAMGWPDDPDRARRVAATLLADGLAMLGPDATWTLPR
jgi:A/G-specific adenine glycosylase